MKKIFVLFLLSVIVISGCDELPKSCTKEAKVCPDGSIVVRVPPDCEFAPCPGGCTVDADCVPATCCHPSSCVPKSQAPDCEGLMCSMECAPGTMDCGQGRCMCIEGKCEAVIYE
ncbi:hypothetical protein KY361_07110 [Candidatus Woesearchaeota archaeon]|nr:hypothetical protein [Candidatus Woesearchaeota archaeon]